jgi:hypothetical protein
MRLPLRFKSVPAKIIKFAKAHAREDEGLNEQDADQIPYISGFLDAYMGVPQNSRERKNLMYRFGYDAFPENAHRLPRVRASVPGQKRKHESSSSGEDEEHQFQDSSTDADTDSEDFKWRSLQRKDGGVIQKIKDVYSSLFKDAHFPKRFRNFLKQHGDEPITKIEMYRVPVDQLGEAVVNLITAGDWEGIKKRAGVDKVYHTGMLLNDKYTFEKLSKLELRESTAYKQKEGAEFHDVPVNGELTINQLVERASKKMGPDFYTYDFLQNNCQNFVTQVLTASGLLDESGRKWIKQDIQKIIEEMPEISKYLGKTITDVSRNVENVGEELFFKRGGKPRRKYRF